MSNFLATNNAESLLAVAISDTDTTIQVTAGEGAKFPSPGAGEVFAITLINMVSELEIVHCTQRATDTLTVLRGQEGTVAKAFAVGHIVQLRPTAEGWTSKADKDTVTADNAVQDAELLAHENDATNPHSVTKTQVGLGNVTDDAQLKIASNLSDLADAATARTNLDVYSKQEVIDTAIEYAIALEE